jgi:putative ABC transport system permease protein
MTNRLVIRNILHRPIRSGLSVLAIAVEVAMILLIAGLADGLLFDSQQRTRGVGADILIRPSTSGAVMSLSTADIPEKLIDRLLQEYPEIELAIGTTLISEGDLQTITGVDWEKFETMAGGIRYLEGGPVEGPFDAIVDEVYARYKKVHVGDVIRLLNQDFRVAGVVESGKMSRIFIPRATMQDLMGWTGKLSQIFLKLKDPAETHQVVDRIKILLPSYPVYAMEDFLSQVASGVREVSSQFVNAIVGIAVVIGFLVVLLSMYSAILERTREIGILKSLGASRTWIVGIVLRETVVVCLAGIVAGMAISYGAREAVRALFPLLSILIAPSWLAWSALIAVFGALFGALYPAARAARHDPIHALTYD